ncbi:CGNR zinc finger domain-containing protein [Streptomyces sp. NRRL F-5630]|uniref:CGNR zinc finger domain-containing protein n=1 Tax=unclassified Streptomyces TaxID=2593676 RepID=UPI0004CB94D9|nr:CGNR zinc finger domain-containing protein [Streptomyces sp. NRRL F-5630]
MSLLPVVPAPFRYDAGRPCLDLLATGHPVERLVTGEDVVGWCVGAGLLPARGPLPQAQPHWLAAAREVRGHLGRLVDASLGGRRAPQSLDRLNAMALAAPPVPQAARAHDGRLVATLHSAPTLSAVLSLLARDTLTLLTDPRRRALLRRCEGEGCPLVYLDTSRGQRRRWCSSEVCGNRERVARHRRRTATGAPPPNPRSSIAGGA